MAAARARLLFGRVRTSFVAVRTGRVSRKICSPSPSFVSVTETFFQKRFWSADVGFAGSALLFLPFLTNSSCSLFLASLLSGLAGDTSGADGGGPTTVGCDTGVALLVDEVDRHRAHIDRGVYRGRVSFVAALSDDLYSEASMVM